MVDPSVQSGGPYGTRSQYNTNPIPQQPSYQTNTVNNPYVPTNMPPNPPLPNPVPMMPTLPQPSQSPFPSQSLGGVDKAEPALSGARMHTFPPLSSAPGWNDPPVLSKPVSRTPVCIFRASF